MSNVITRTLTAIFGASEPTVRKPATTKLSLCTLEGRDMPAAAFVGTLSENAYAYRATPPSQPATAARPTYSEDQRDNSDLKGKIASQTEANSREVGLANRQRDRRRG